MLKFEDERFRVFFLDNDVHIQTVPFKGQICEFKKVMHVKSIV